MNRREFIALVAAAPWAAAAQQPAGSRGQVIVIGAGLAGLAAAWDLQRAGFAVTVLEARARAGGRVHTLREPFSDGLYAEAGAARIQDTHAFTLRWVRELNLTLDPFFPTEGLGVSLVAGHRVETPPGKPFELSAVPLEYTAEERSLGLRGGLRKYLFSHVEALGDATDPAWPRGDLSRFEMPIAEFCRRQGASPAFLRLVALGHDLSDMSTLQFLRDVSLGITTRQWFKIRGGSDRLPAALAARLSDVIRYGAPVVRIALQSDRVLVTWLRDRTPVMMPADYIISTIPAPVLAGIEVTPAWPAPTLAAIREHGGLPMARVHLQTSQRFWLPRGYSGFATTDDPMDVWDYSRDQPGPRGILGAYLSGGIAREVTGMPAGDRGRFVLERMERVHPGTREHVETSASYSWIDDPWARGAGAAFHPGQLSRHYQALRAPVGRVHFAGEHTSPWSGWMNGALESGHRAASEILARAGVR